MNPNLETIIAGCIKWDRRSQRQLYKIFYPYGMSIAIRYMKDEAEAELVVNDSFLKVYNKIESYNRHQDFKPWFRKILVNTSINHLKKNKKLVMKTNLSEIEHLADRENILSSLSYKDLVNMVQSLSHAYSTVFNMYVIDGFKHEEIAQKLGISVGTSKSNLSKARAKLKTLIEEQLILENGQVSR